VRGDVIPLRPLTLAERLDAAVELLRRNAVGLLSVSAVLAVLEQGLLFPLRRLAGVAPPFYVDIYLHHLGAYWLLVATGLGTEAAIIAMLGGLAARAAVPALTGGPAAPRWLGGRGSRLGALVLLALVVGAGAALTAAAGLVPWFAWYVFTGLAAPALIVERRAPFGAVGRSFVMVGRGHLRPGGNRLLGYLAWFFIRLALAIGGVQALLFVAGLRGSGWLYAASVTAWVVVNTIAYAVLACLDAVLHLENRMRVEGLDIALTRALRRGAPTARILVGDR
jgi:hypothetical protein